MTPHYDLHGYCHKYDIDYDLDTFIGTFILDGVERDVYAIKYHMIDNVVGVYHTVIVVWQSIGALRAQRYNQEPTRSKMGKIAWNMARLSGHVTT